MTLDTLDFIVYSGMAIFFALTIAFLIRDAIAERKAIREKELRRAIFAGDDSIWLSELSETESKLSEIRNLA